MKCLLNLANVWRRVVAARGKHIHRNILIDPDLPLVVSLNEMCLQQKHDEHIMFLGLPTWRKMLGSEDMTSWIACEATTSHKTNRIFLNNKRGFRLAVVDKLFHWEFETDSAVVYSIGIEQAGSRNGSQQMETFSDFYFFAAVVTRHSASTMVRCFFLPAEVWRRIKGFPSKQLMQLVRQSL